MSYNPAHHEGRDTDHTCDNGCTLEGKLERSVEFAKGRKLQKFTLWRHIKTGNTYRVLYPATDATNATNGRPMVVYRREEEADGLVPKSVEYYVRERSEFLQKFDHIVEPEVVDE